MISETRQVDRAIAGGFIQRPVRDKSGLRRRPGIESNGSTAVYPAGTRTESDLGPGRAQSIVCGNQDFRKCIGSDQCMSLTRHGEAIGDVSQLVGVFGSVLRHNSCPIRLNQRQIVTASAELKVGMQFAVADTSVLAGCKDHKI